MITLRPSGGLCNRMLAVDSAVKLCKYLKKDLNIHWLKNHYLNASFFELFEPIQDSDFKITFEITDKKSRLYSEREFYKPKQRLYNSLLKIYQSLFFNKIINGYNVPMLFDQGYDFRKLGKYNNVLISSWSRFMPGQIDTSLFKPTSAIQSRIDELTSLFTENTIGIHIRRGDHKRSIALSPTAAFIDRMNEEIMKNANTRFFVASDSEEDKTLLKSRFGDRMITSNMDKGDRNSTNGMQDAVVDLYCLASTKHIIGSFYSTFSLVASELNQITFEEIKISKS